MTLRDLIIDRLEEPVERFCKKIKISRPVITGIINGIYKHNISLVTIKKICKYFDVDFKDYI